VIALTKSLGKELARTGVLVNCVTPAREDRDLRPDDPEISTICSPNPMNRFVTVEEIASLVCWLASRIVRFRPVRYSIFPAAGRLTDMAKKLRSQKWFGRQDIYALSTAAG